MLKKVIEDVTFGVSSVGNNKALMMCLASVLNASRIPARIQIRFEGPLPSFAEYYFEQLSELARFHGVDWVMQVCKSQGIREARDWHLSTCPTPFLWMGDDDVVYEYDCLSFLRQASDDVSISRGSAGNAYFCGTKGDLNNRRGYGNFKMDIHGPADVYANCPFNWFYDKEACQGMYARIYTADTGNIFIDMDCIRKNGIKFNQFSESLNSGGEDTIFALECGLKDLEAWIVPSARSYHLEKEQVNFNEFAARGEMVLRVCELREYKKEQVDYLKKVFFPWLPWK